MARVSRTTYGPDGSKTTTTQSGCENCSGIGCGVIALMAILAAPAYYFPAPLAALTYVVALGAMVAWVVVVSRRNNAKAKQ
jgi:hypothetical protein